MTPSGVAGVSQPAGRRAAVERRSDVVSEQRGRLAFEQTLHDIRMTVIYPPPNRGLGVRSPADTL